MSEWIHIEGYSGTHSYRKDYIVAVLDYGGSASFKSTVVTKDGSHHYRKPRKEILALFEEIL